MRGKAVGDDFLGPVYGITPAYAGKSFTKGIFSTRAKDHPRLCGEKLTVAIYSHLFSGSPPPMRGKGAMYRPGILAARITPAYAGKSSTAYPDQTNQGDHPRLCGEKYSENHCGWWICGSPPPMRGKVLIRQGR